MIDSQHAKLARWLPIAGWLALTGSAVWYVLKYGANCPYLDEWDLARVFTREITLGQLVTQPHNEHHYPLGQAIWVWLTEAAGFDFRAGMLANVLFLSLAAAALLRAVRTACGPSPADLLLPALLLHFGQVWYWLFGYYVTLSLPFAALAGIMALAATYRKGREVPCGGLAGALLLIVMNAGWYGVPMVPFIGGWIALLAWRSWHQPRNALAMLFLAALATGYAIYCALELPSLRSERPPFSLEQFVLAVRTGFGLTLGVGPSELIGPVLGWLAIAVTLFAFGRLGWILATNPDERMRAAGLGATLAALVVVLIAVALGRGNFPLRASLTPALIAVNVVLVFRVYPLRRWPGMFALLAAVLAIAVASLNWSFGLAWGSVHRNHYRDLYEDIHSGVPVSYMASRHSDWFRLEQGMPLPRATDRLQALRRAKIGWFAELRDDPATVALPASDPGVKFAPGDGQKTTISSLGRRVLGVRLRFEGERKSETAGVIAWVSRDGGTPRARYFTRTFEPGGDDMLVWVDDNPGDVTIYFTQQTEPLRLVGVAWLIPG